MTTTKAKRGRKPKPYKCPWNNETVDGLYPCPDGRWRIVATGQKFTEPDPRLAVAKFYRLTNAARDVTIEPSPELVKRIDTATRDDLRVRKIIGRTLDEGSVWAWVREQIITRPKYVAERTGIEQLGYLADLPKPVPSPTLDDVGELYFTKSNITPHWLSKSRLFWGEFCDSVGVRTLREVTQEHVADYKADVLDAPPSRTYVAHRFGQVKTIIAYSKHWGKWADDRARALSYCTILTPPEGVTLDPQPIERATFHALHDAADVQLKAILLLCLNCCMYGHEVSELRWPDFDLDNGVLVADRGKTKVARVAVLWGRTVDALRELPRLTDAPFLTDATKQPHNANTIGKLFRDVRTVAKVSSDVKLCHVRDGAYTSAVEGEAVQYEHARILAGHRTGQSDHYIKRRPRIVAAACEAIERAYFG